MGDFVPENEKKVFVISEAGVNHNGNPDMAFKLIEAGAEATVWRALSDLPHALREEVVKRRKTRKDGRPETR